MSSRSSCRSMTSMAQQVVVAHPVGRDRFQPLQKIIGFRMLARDLLQRILSEQRVVTVVAHARRSLRRILQPRLIELIKQFILLRHAIGYRRHLRETRRRESKDESENNMSHIGRR